MATSKLNFFGAFLTLFFGKSECSGDFDEKTQLAPEMSQKMNLFVKIAATILETVDWKQTLTVICSQFLTWLIDVTSVFRSLNKI